METIKLTDMNNAEGVSFIQKFLKSSSKYEIRKTSVWVTARKPKKLRGVPLRLGTGKELVLFAKKQRKKACFEVIFWLRSQGVMIKDDNFLCIATNQTSTIIFKYRIE